MPVATPEAMEAAVAAALEPFMKDIFLDMDELLKPVRDRRDNMSVTAADELSGMYKTFQDMTNEQLKSAGTKAAGDRGRFLADVHQRAHVANKSFKMTACAMLEELKRPTALTDTLMQRRQGTGRNGANSTFGPETARGLAAVTIEQINAKRTHFWNSVQKRVEKMEEPADKPAHPHPHATDTLGANCCGGNVQGRARCCR